MVVVPARQVYDRFARGEGSPKRGPTARRDDLEPRAVGKTEVRLPSGIRAPPVPVGRPDSGGARSAGDQRELGRYQQYVAWLSYHRQGISALDRGGWEYAARASETHFLVTMKRARQLRHVVNSDFRTPSCQTECLQPSRHARKRREWVERLRQLRRAPTDGSFGERWRSTPCRPRRFLGRRSADAPRGRTRLERRRQPGLHLRLPVGQNVKSLIFSSLPLGSRA